MDWFLYDSDSVIKKLNGKVRDFVFLFTFKQSIETPKILWEPINRFRILNGGKTSAELEQSLLQNFEA